MSPLSHDCATPQRSANGVYVVLFIDPAMPLATCQLALHQDTQTPGMPTNLGAQWQPDGSLQLSWSPPGDGHSYNYAIVATTADGQPAILPLPLSQSQYSMCLPGGRMLRRSLLTSELALV